MGYFFYLSGITILENIPMKAIRRCFFDIDGTVISLRDEIRPFTLDLWKFLSENGIRIYIFSGGGPDYARKHAHRVDPDYEVHKTVIPKQMGIFKEGDFVVDDSKDTIDMCKILGGDGYRIPFFEPLIELNDTEMLKIKDLINERLS